MQSLGQHLRADAALSAVQVNYGLRQPGPEQDTIHLRYGGSPGFDLDDNDRGSDRLWLDVVTPLADADAATDHDTGAAYAQLHTLARTVLASVRAWWTTAELNGATFSAAVTEVQGDGDTLRDVQCAGVRIVLTINWVDISGG